MKARYIVLGVVVVACLLLGAGIALAQGPAAPEEDPALALEGAELDASLSAAVGTGFTYQGRLLVNGEPANGTYDLRFDVQYSSVPTFVETSTIIEDVVVTDGTFSVVVDWGKNVFNGSAIWALISVRPAGGTEWTQLLPRQRLTPAPYALGLALPITGSMASTVPLFTMENTQSGYAIVGTSASSDGILGSTEADADTYLYNIAPAGVRGRATATGFGVRGTAIDGAAVVADVANALGEADVFLGRKWSVLGGIAAYNTVFRVTGAGEVTADGAFTPGGADLAEFIDASESLEPGDVVEIDPEHEGQFRLAATANSALVAGVISTEPGVRLGSREGADGMDERPQLALAGTVPVKVCDEGGPIQPGTLLVASSVAGHAMAAPDDPAPGTVIGKALGSLDGGEGVVRMLVMLR